MSYYLNCTVSTDFEETIAAVTEALKTEGFGVLTYINMTEKLKEKIGVDFRKYVIIGACNPPLAYKALQVEDKIGVMLPCNVVVQERGIGEVEVAAINPSVSMQSIQNPELELVAKQVQEKLEKVIHSLG
jgi:uncharacterized protein (DUF302 family)